MIITKTPFRVSFFGGGTDYPEHFLQHGGAVLGTAIGHSAFLSVSRFYSRLFDYNLRIAYRMVECVQSVDEIQHAAFRECLRRHGIVRDIEVNYTANLPSFSGLGSSSSFIVGLLNALHTYRGRTVAPLDLAYEAIEMERSVLQENVGCQDQTLAAVGGFNVIEFHAMDDIRVHPIQMSPDRLECFEQHLLMFYTGIRRRASEVAGRQIQRIGENSETLLAMCRMVDMAHRCLTGADGLHRFGELLDESWRMKQSLDEGVSSPEITDLYRAGCEAGALGGKLLGAGGGGFLLFFVPPERQPSVMQRLAGLECVPLTINSAGSHVLHESAETPKYAATMV